MAQTSKPPREGAAGRERSSKAAGARRRLEMQVRFGALREPRRHAHKIHYPLELILLCTLTGVLCGYASWEAIADFAEEEEDWLRSLVPYAARGTPSADTLLRVFALLDEAVFARCFSDWVRALLRHLRPEAAEGGSGREHVALDGKALAACHAPAAPTQPLQLLHAYLVDARLLLGWCEAHGGASGEPAAAMRLLEVLEVEGRVVTGDANFMTREVADAIVERGGHYVLCLKGNRGPAHAAALAEVEARLGPLPPTDAGAPPPPPPRGARLEGAAHGRQEARAAHGVPAQDVPALVRYLPHARALLCLTRWRQNGQDAPSLERTLYVSDLSLQEAGGADGLAAWVRAHWQVENGLHYGLDMLLHEDQVRARPGPAARNLACVRRTVHTALQTDPNRDPKHSLTSHARRLTLNRSKREALLQHVFS